MDKLKLAHDWAMKSFSTDGFKDEAERATCAWKYADAMQAEADERNKAEAAQKRKEIREMLDATNTFVKREGQHFDDLAPTWDQGPNVLTTEDAEKYKNMIKREFDLYNNPPPKIEKRKSIHAEVLCEVDWCVAPCWAKEWVMRDGVAKWEYGTCADSWEFAPSFGFTGSHIVERPHGL